MSSLVETPFKLTLEETLCSAAVTLCLLKLAKIGTPVLSVAEICFTPQYGFTASASSEQCGPRFVRITDIKGGFINWDTVPFCECADPSSYELEAGDIIIARSGSVGKSFLISSVPETAVFASYMIRLRAKPNFTPLYIYWCLQSQQFWQQIMETQRGSAMKNINGKMLSSLKFPMPSQEIQDVIADFLSSFRAQLRRREPIQFLPYLPSFLSEEQQIVARIEELAARIEEARGLRREIHEHYDALCRSILADTSDGVPTLILMRELVKLRELDITVSPEEVYWFAGVYSFGKGLFRGQHKRGTEFSYNRLTRLKTGNFVYPKLMAWEGAFAIVPPECDGLVVSPEFPVFEIDQQRVLPETLEVYFHIPSVWLAVSGASTGTNVRRRRLNPADFLASEIPLPPMKTQKRLREVKAKLDQINKLQAETSAELDALLPSILDKAFKGDL